MNKDITFSIYDAKLLQIPACLTFLKIRNSDKYSIYPKLSQKVTRLFAKDACSTANFFFYNGKWAQFGFHVNWCLITGILVCWFHI